MIIIEYLRRKCIGCNACVENAPNNWEMNEEDGKSTLKNSKKQGDYYISTITMDELEENKNAEENCPVNIIRIREK